MADPVLVGADQRTLRLFDVDAVTVGASGLSGGPLGVGGGGGDVPPTVTVTALEQLLPVSDSPDTASTQAP